MPSSDSMEIVRSLPGEPEEIAAKLIDMLIGTKTLPSSLYKNRIGYFTYSIRCQVQFNSLNYVKNFLREECKERIVTNIIDMQKFKNQKGVIFNIPEEIKGSFDNFIDDIINNRKKIKGY